VTLLCVAMIYASEKAGVALPGIRCARTHFWQMELHRRSGRGASMDSPGEDGQVAEERKIAPIET
jgi:hypothetical protein